MRYRAPSRLSLRLSKKRSANQQGFLLFYSAGDVNSQEGFSRERTESSREAARRVEDPAKLRCYAARFLWESLANMPPRKSKPSSGFYEWHKASNRRDEIPIQVSPCGRSSPKRGGSLGKHVSDRSDRSVGWRAGSVQGILPRVAARFGNGFRFSTAPRSLPSQSAG